MSAVATTTMGAFRQAVIDALTTEFAADEIPFFNTRLPPGAAHTDGPFGAVHSEGWQEVPGRVNEITVGVRVQLFDRWQMPEGAMYDAAAALEGYADRIVSTLRVGEHATAWFIRATGVQMGLDPAGRQTRFEVFVTGRRDNPFGF